MNHVFISYVRKNIDLVTNLRTSLENSKIKTWMDKDDINPGARWELVSCPVILYLQNLHFEMTGFSVIVNPLIVDRYMFINSLIQISGLFKTHYLGPFKINVFMERN